MTVRRIVAWTMLLSLPLGVAIGCGDSEDEDEHAGEPTGATCPAASILTYDNFGKPFMDKYCVRCHSSALSGADRNGAPIGHDFDTLAGILLVADHIDERAAGGPNAVNESMPPDGDKPTEAERRQLGEWLACERNPSDASTEDAASD